MRKRPRSKRKGKKKKKTAIEELVDSSIQLPEINYFISQADRHGGNDKYSLIKQMLNALKYDDHTATGIESKSLVVRDHITGVPLHFVPAAKSLVSNRGRDFTFYDPHIGNVQNKTKANKLSERLANEEAVLGRYKNNPVIIQKIDKMPVDDVILSIKAHEDIMPFNDPPRH